MNKSKEKEGNVFDLVKSREIQAKAVTHMQKEVSQCLSSDQVHESLVNMFGGNDKIPEAMREEFENIRIMETESKDELFTKLIMNNFSMTETVNLEDPYGDGDQSMLYGTDAMKFQIQWGHGFDYNITNNRKLSDWCKSLYFARIDDVNNYITKAKEGSKSDLTQLLNRRESMMRFGGVLHIIAGARESPSPRHHKLMKILLDAGANPNLKDCAGYTPLHHCLTIYGNSMTLKLAKLLLEYGADVNAQNRFGYTPLFEPCIQANMEFIELLMSNGAKPTIEANNGDTCETLAILNPKIQSMFSKGMRAQAKKDKVKEKDSSVFISCVLCGNVDNLKRCTACCAVSYCSRECQKTHWKTHKFECKKDCKIIIVKPVEKLQQYDMDNYFLLNEKHKMVIGSDNVFSELKKPFKIKVQTIFRVKSSERKPMMVYNKDRSYKQFILPTDNGYKEVYDTVSTKGYSGIKAYFCATIDKPGELAINVSTVFAETW